MKIVFNNGKEFVVSKKRENKIMKNMVGKGRR